MEYGSFSARGKHVALTDALILEGGQLVEGQLRRTNCDVAFDGFKGILLRTCSKAAVGHALKEVVFDFFVLNLRVTRDKSFHLRTFIY